MAEQLRKVLLSQSEIPKQQTGPQAQPPSSNPKASRMGLGNLVMEEKYIDQAKHTVQERPRSIKRVSGEPRMPAPPGARCLMLNSIQQAANQTPLNLKQDPKATVFLALHVDLPYPPCTTPISQLQPVTILQLRMDIHLRGRVLFARRIGPVHNPHMSARALLEDQTGDVETIQVYLHKNKHGSPILHFASVFAIKEPYMSLDDHMGHTTRVDHPSNIVLLEGSEATSKFLSSYKESVKTPAKCKEEGNKALKDKAAGRAWDCYTAVLYLAANNAQEPDDITRNLSRNRAHTNLLLCCYDKAKTDAVASLSNHDDDRYKGLDSKAYFLLVAQLTTSGISRRLGLSASTSCN